MVGAVAEIWRYPVKSMAGERLDSVSLAETGLEADRRWALVDGAANRAGKLFTATEDKHLMTYRAQMNGHGVEVVTPGGEVRRLDAELVSRIASDTGRPLSLRDRAGANFDDSPVLIVNLPTVAAFSLEAHTTVDHRRFRANFYIDGFEPDEEVRWLGRRIRVGAAQLEVVKRCERCVVITHDPDTTATTPALLRVLTRTSETCMGIYCRVLRPGVVGEGDRIGPE
ncbi:MAG TPA: MOSC domain-containing protein [Candidatus Micrarchaeaceae archaeon]|nr:MOSC domain-containing protein [Candidatus Micrarchaeaceae archaeon]